jgi:hypothetical protein
MAAAFSLEPPNQDSASASKSDKLLARHASDQASHAAKSSPIELWVRSLPCLAKNLFACKKAMRFLGAEGFDSRKV